MDGTGPVHTRLMTLPEVADWLRLSKRTVQKRIAEGLLTPIRSDRDRRLTFTIDEARRYVRERNGG